MLDGIGLELNPINYSMSMSITYGQQSNIRQSMLPQGYKVMGRISLNDQMNAYTTTLNEFYEMM